MQELSRENGEGRKEEKKRKGETKGRKGSVNYERREKRKEVISSNAHTAQIVLLVWVVLCDCVVGSCGSAFGTDR